MLPDYGLIFSKCPWATRPSSRLRYENRFSVMQRVAIFGVVTVVAIAVCAPVWGQESESGEVEVPAVERDSVETPTVWKPISGPTLAMQLAGGVVGGSLAAATGVGLWYAGAKAQIEALAWWAIGMVGVVPIAIGAGVGVGGDRATQLSVAGSATLSAFLGMIVAMPVTGVLVFRDDPAVVPAAIIHTSVPLVASVIGYQIAAARSDPPRARQWSAHLAVGSIGDSPGVRLQWQF